MYDFLRLRGHHFASSLDMLDSSIAAEDALAQPVTLVAEGGLPGHHDVLRKVQSHRDRVRHLASIFLGKHTA